MQPVITCGHDVPRNPATEKVKKGSSWGAPPAGHWGRYERRQSHHYSEKTVSLAKENGIHQGSIVPGHFIRGDMKVSGLVDIICRDCQAQLVSSVAAVKY